MAVVENGILGLLAGAVGVLGAHIVATLLFRYQFAMTYQADLPVYLLIAAATAAGFGVLGQAFGRAGPQASLLRALQPS